MTLEERIELHDQWLRSMESSHNQFVADLADFKSETREQISLIMGILSQVTQNLALLSATMAALAEQHRKLEEAVEQYIRFRSDGRQQN